MKNNNLKKISIVAFVIAVAFFVFIVYASKMPSYLSDDPKACINCHVMNTQYATWQHSSHARDAVCIDCHLPQEGFFRKYKTKAIDGWNHSKAFTMNSYKPAIEISDGGAKIVQENCISCHKSIVSTITANADKYHNFENPEVATGRRCWDCHKSVPHGKVRATTTTPNNLGVKEVE